MATNQNATDRKLNSKIERKQFRRLLYKMSTDYDSENIDEVPKLKRPSYLKYIDYI